MFVKIIDKTSTQYRDLCQLSGPLFSAWCEAWMSLSVNERDIYTHPVLIMSWLGALTHFNNEYFQLCCLYEGDELITIIPFQIYTVPFSFGHWCYMKSPMIEFGSSVAIPQRYREQAANTLLEIQIAGHSKVKAIGFLQIDNTNSFLSISTPHTIFRTGYTRNILDITKYCKEQGSKNFKRHLHKSLYKLKQMGSVNFEIIDVSDEIMNAFDHFVEFEASGWKHDQRITLRNNPILYQFTRDTILGFAAANNAVVFNLKCNDILICSFVCIFDNTTLYGLRIAYDETYRITSPGLVLIDFIFRNYCPGHNLSQYNSMSSSPWFKEKYHPSIMETSSLFLFQPGITGSILKTGYNWYKRLNWLGQRINRRNVFLSVFPKLKKHKDKSNTI